MDKFKQISTSLLSTELIESFEGLSNTLIGLTNEQFFEKNLNGTGGVVSIADILSYQIGWGHLLIKWYEHGVKNEQMTMPGDGFSKWNYNAIAKHFYQKYSCLTPEQLKKELVTVITRIIEIIEYEFSLGHLDKIAVWAWCQLPSGINWPLSKWIRVNTISPYKRATKIIKKSLKLL